MKKMIMIKYGELTTKKDNRKMFIQVLAKNIKNLLKEYVFELKYDRVRMYIYADDSLIEDIALKLSKIFGIHSIVICHSVDTNIEEIQSKVLELLKNKKFDTFKVETKRADKRFEIPSMDFNCVMGGFILKNFDCKVDVHHPDILVHIEIRVEGTFLYTDCIVGSGGYPVGIQGKGMLMLSGGIDSPVAGYLALKRGVTIECLYFESPPHTSLEAKNKVIKLTSILNDYAGNIILHVVPFTKLQESIFKNVPSNYMITIMRRMMYRIAERYARIRHCEILVNGESVGQVASQTTTSISVINEVTNMPVIRPVACMDKLEIIAVSKKIGTYETSILPFEDCCTIFVPKHPIIHPKLDKCLLYESNFDYECLVDECVSNIEVISNFRSNDYSDLL